MLDDIGYGFYVKLQTPSQLVLTLYDICLFVSPEEFQSVGSEIGGGGRSRSNR